MFGVIFYIFFYNFSYYRNSKFQMFQSLKSFRIWISKNCQSVSIIKSSGILFFKDVKKMFELFKLSEIRNHLFV
jgi:hypothetical protein